MALVTFFVKKRAVLSLQSNPAALVSNDSLLPCELFFKLDLQGLSEADVLAGKRRVPVRVQVREKGRPGFILDEQFNFHGDFPATHGHLENLRYISPSGRHFCATFQKLEHRYCELLLIDQQRGQVTRFIPTDLPLWN